MVTVQQLIDACRREAMFTEGLDELPGSPLWKEGMRLIGKKFAACASVMEEQQAMLSIGDRMAHELMHKDHPHLLDLWWKSRGGHDACTVCNGISPVAKPTDLPPTQPVSCTPKCFYHGTAHLICMAF